MRQRQKPWHPRSICLACAPLVAWWTIAATACGQSLETATDVIDFNSQVRSILQDRCFRCHGPDKDTRESGLRLDYRDGALAELDSGLRAIVPQDADSSELIVRVTSTDEDLRMPPVDAGEPLSDAEIAILRRWIAQGANYQQHWSFIAPRFVRPALPLSRSEWARNPIDAFVLRRLHDQGLVPAEQADRYTLIRRLSLDLIGLSPTIREVDQFVNDPHPDAYPRLVDRLLQSPAFGERWARVWLDLARYADSAGYAQDPPRVIWRYRDWVIDSFNRNLPYDQFTIEQIAGDLLPQPTTDQLLATAFHRNTMTNSEGGTDDEEFRTAAVVDRVNTTMQVWMGLTMGCAQCHSHKYDPISQEEYFQFYAIFNNTADADRADESPTLREYTAAEESKRAELQDQIEQLKAELTEKESELEVSSEPSTQQPELAALRAQIAKLEQDRAAIQGILTPIMRELPDDQQRTTHIQIRGNFLARGPEVLAAVPSAFHAPQEGNVDRLNVARWLVDKNNPLSARVAVNRCWEQLFGVGLVETSEDFGTQGEPPSHPQLLDYLASKFTDQGWDTKWLLREIVMSAAYRQASNTSEEKLEIDPNNRLLSRGPNFRLSAEMIRDQALSIAGLLSRKMHGPSVRPPRPVLGLRSAFGGSTDWETSAGEDRFRRGIYTRWRRTTPYPSMTTFDAPSREVCTIRRVRTNTPLQALVTLNDPVFVEAAQGLARRMLAEPDLALEDRIAYGFRLCLARPPSQLEVARLVELYRQVLRDYAEHPEQAEQMAFEPLGRPSYDVVTQELAAWTVVANVLLNLDELLAKK